VISSRPAVSQGEALEGGKVENGHLPTHVVGRCRFLCEAGHKCSTIISAAGQERFGQVVVSRALSLITRHAGGRYASEA